MGDLAVIRVRFCDFILMINIKSLERSQTIALRSPLKSPIRHKKDSQAGKWTLLLHLSAYSGHCIISIHSLMFAINLAAIWLSNAKVYIIKVTKHQIHLIPQFLVPSFSVQRSTTFKLSALFFFVFLRTSDTSKLDPDSLGPVVTNATLERKQKNKKQR